MSGSTTDYTQNAFTTADDGGQDTGQAPAATDSSDPSLRFIQQQTASQQGAQMAAEDMGAKPASQQVADLFGKGIPLAGAAIANSFYNTAVEVGNFFGADAHKETIEDEFGPDSDTTSYYQQHAGIIEGAALAVGSLAPGMAGVKMLKLAQIGRFGETMSTATGLFSGVREAAISSAAEDMAGNATGSSLFGNVGVQKVKAVLAGAADQALQGAAYQTATLATMHASPITDNNTMSDNVADVWDAMKGFATVGGLIDGAGAIYKIKSAVRALDMSTKEQQAFGALGVGNLTPGDRVVNLYGTLDKIPQPTSALGKMQLNSTTNTTGRMVQEQLIAAAKGDEELAGGFRGFLEKGRADGSIGPSELQDNLGQLTRIGRMSDTDVASVPNDVFYVPSKVDPGIITTASHDELMSRISSPSLNTQTSRALTLTSPTMLPTIMRATDTVTLPGLGGNPSIVFNQFGTTKSPVALAYKTGADIFVDAKGVTHINPDTNVFKEVPRPGESRILNKAERTVYQTTGNLPAGAKPLNGVGLTLDLTNGKLFGEDPLPVVGDFAKPTLAGPSGKLGLRVGDTVMPQVPSMAISPDMKPLDANARYVWASMRGSRAGDVVDPSDLPMLEQIYREKVAGFEHEGLDTFSDGTSFPDDAQDLLSHIADTKASLYSDMLGAGKDADTIGQVLNAPTVGLTKNFNTLNPLELIQDPATSANIRHVRLAYDIGTTKDGSGNLLRGMQATNYRVQLAKDGNATQVGNYLAQTVGTNDPSGNVSQQFFSALQFTKGIGDADIAGAGSSFLTNANADFGTLAQQAERIGKTAADLSTIRRSIVSSALAPSLNALRLDPAASAEFGNFQSVIRSTGEHFAILSDADATAAGLPPNTVALEGAIARNAQTGTVSVNKNYLPPGFQAGDGTDTNLLKNYYTLGDKTADALRANQGLINFRNQLRSDWWKAQGIPKEAYPTDRVYLPPIDGSKFPFMAYVKQRDGYAMGEGGAAVLTGKDAADLQNKIGLLGPEFDAFTKGDIANFKKAQDEFQFNRNFMSNKANTELSRKGLLTNVAPETRAANIINELADWHFRQEDLLLRDHIEMHNAATFDQLKAMGDRFEQTGTSRFGAITPFMQRSATNPYQSYIRTALGLSPRDQYPLWQLAQDKLEAFGGTAFNIARDAFGATQRGVIPVADAAKLSERFGLGSPYGTAIDQMSKSYYGGLANQLPDPKILSRFIGTANTVLGAGIIRLDTIQQLIHAVTLPIMTAMEHSSATADLKKLMSVTVPDSATQALPGGLQVPGFTRSLFQAVKNYFSDDGTLASLYSQSGLTRDELQIHRQMINELTMPQGKLSETGWAQKIDNATQLGEKLTGSKFTNSFIHFIASDVGRQIGEATGQAGRDLSDTIGTFTNRVLGNISAGQRAAIFSGPVGQAIGLFQSYQWNLMQQLFRHIGEGDVKALAMGAGMQASIFGLSSLPGFQVLNTMIAQRYGNTQGQDIYSGTGQLLPPQVADYLLYGSLSGLTGLSLYSRGDLNPRRATILPVNPLQTPGVAAGIRVYNTLSQLEQNVTTKGGSVPASLLLAAEHNGLSRPLSGLAEMVQGFSTAPNGNLISAQTNSTTAGMSDLAGVSNMSRILGARPLEEAVGLDAMYRRNAVQVTDNARLNELGSTLKTQLYGNNQVSPDTVMDFMADYVKAGGNQTNFNKWWLTQNRDANVSEVNRAYHSLTNPRAVALQETMGGIPLPDFRMQPSTTVSQSGSPSTPDVIGSSQ